MSAELEAQSKPASQTTSESTQHSTGSRASVQLKGKGYSEQSAALRPTSSVQMKGGDVQKQDIHEVAAAGTKGGGGSIPHLDAIQSAFGRHDVGSVRAHTGAEAVQATASMGAEAYASGNNIAFNSAPSLHTAAHEAAHIVQQRGGVSLSGGVGQVGDRYEQHADAVADAVVAGKSAEGLLDNMNGSSASSGVQQKAVQCELTAEQRRDIEARTGPLVEEQQGPYEDHLGANRSAVESCYQTGIGVWRTAAQTAITDFVRDNDHAPNYGPLIMALVALPMGYVGIGLNGAAAVGHLVASTAISALDAVPPSDRVAGFRTGMRSAYDRIYENRINSTSAIISNWQNGLNAGASSDLTQLKLGMMTNCFRRDFVTGTAVNAEGVRNVVYNAVKAAWDRIEAERRAARAERQGDIGDAYAEMDYCWVAREVVPSRWTEVRSYLLNVAPEHIRALYGEKGPQLAVALRADTGTRQSLRPLFEQVAEAGRTWQETGDTRAATLPESTFAPLVSLLHAS